MAAFLARTIPPYPRLNCVPVNASVDPTDARNGNTGFRDWRVRCYPPVVLL
jgi:hypothetical protein